MTRHRDDQAVVVIEKDGGIGTFFAGLALGAGLALLLAPKSGEETRADLAARARRLRDRAEEGLDELSGTIETGYERARASVEEGLDTARERFNEGRSRAGDAVQAGRAAVRSARDELDRRLAEERDEDEGAEDEE